MKQSKKKKLLLNISDFKNSRVTNNNKSFQFVRNKLFSFEKTKEVKRKKEKDEDKKKT